jgi:hypothetical protein
MMRFCFPGYSTFPEHLLPRKVLNFPALRDSRHKKTRQSARLFTPYI